MKELLERILVDPQYLALDVDVQLRILIANGESPEEIHP